MSKVYVVQENLVFDGTGGAPRPKHDLSGVMPFGELVYVFQHGPMALMPSANSLALRGVRDFDPEEDYVLVIGDYVLALMVACALQASGKAPFRTLRFDSRSRTYATVWCGLNVTETEEPNGNVI